MKISEITSACNYFEQNFPSCTSCNQQSTWVCKDKGESREYRIENVRDVILYKVRIDDCVIKDTTQNKCDFLMLCCEADKKYAIFVELKGDNFAHACKQIFNTIKLLKEHINSLEYQYCARIVLSKAPKILASSTKQKGGLPDIRDSNYVELIKKLSKNTAVSFDFSAETLIEKKVNFSSKI
jgi:hypothetical protein